MRFTRLVRRIILLAALPLLLLAVPAVSAATASAATGTGWIRLAHLSPNTPAVDVYLYSFGDSSAQIVLHHVAYGTVSPYEQVPAGDYTVAMRAAGAAASSAPVLSASVDVAQGRAYTVAGLGPESGLRLQVLDDQLSTPSGKALVRVIQASLKQSVVSVNWGGQSLDGSLKFGSVSSYQTVSPGTATLTVSGGGDQATASVPLAAGTVHTLVVLDGAKGLQIDNLLEEFLGPFDPMQPAHIVQDLTASHSMRFSSRWIRRPRKHSMRAAPRTPAPMTTTSRAWDICSRGI